MYLIRIIIIRLAHRALRIHCWNMEHAITSSAPAYVIYALTTWTVNRRSRGTSQFWHRSQTRVSPSFWRHWCPLLMRTASITSPIQWKTTIIFRDWITGAPLCYSGLRRTWTRSQIWNKWSWCIDFEIAFFIFLFSVYFKFIHSFMIIRVFKKKLYILCIYIITVYFFILEWFF